ncbi:MAG: hypothetical protein F6K28_53600 [Microcoleus sp. SIO2G3]|nr:hypothetical protein [Microcoleus sp. SIO2G3]
MEGDERSRSWCDFASSLRAIAEWPLPFHCLPLRRLHQDGAGDRAPDASLVGSSIVQ